MGSPVCVDASLVIRLVLDDSLSEEAARRFATWRAEERAITAPDLMRYEVSNALHRLHRQRLLSAGATDEALEAVLRLPIVILAADADLHRRALSMARALGLPAAYDAHYLALAEAAEAELWTADGKLARAVHGRLPWVRLLGDRR